MQQHKGLKAAAATQRGGKQLGELLSSCADKCSRVKVKLRRSASEVDLFLQQDSGLVRNQTRCLTQNRFQLSHPFQEPLPGPGAQLVRLRASLLADGPIWQLSEPFRCL